MSGPPTKPTKFAGAPSSRPPFAAAPPLSARRPPAKPATASAASAAPSAAKSKKPAQPPASPQVATVLAPARSTPLPALYADALHCIFAFCGLPELSVCLRVSRHWSAAAESLPPLLVAWTARPPLKRICESRLARHLSELSFPAHVPCTPLLLSALTARLINLRTLVWTLPVPAGATKTTIGAAWPEGVADYKFPPTLRTLVLNFPHHAPSAIVRDSVVAVSRSCPALVELRVNVSTFSSLHQVRLDPLQRLPQLRLLQMRPVVCPPDLSGRLLSVAQLSDLRALVSLESLELWSLSDQQSILALIDSPQQPQQPLQWTALPEVSPHWTVDDALADRIVAALPQLTSLPSIAFTGASLGWLTRLPALRTLKLSLHDCPALPSALLPGLRSCVQLTSLSLSRLAGWSEADLIALLSPMAALRSLTLIALSADQPPSFLSAVPSLAHGLETLSLDYARRCEPEALAALLDLRSLRELVIRGPWSGLPPSLAKSFQPHSKHLPQLSVFRLLPGIRGGLDDPVIDVDAGPPPRGSMAEGRLRERERVDKAKAWLKEQKKAQA